MQGCIIRRAAVQRERRTRVAEEEAVERRRGTEKQRQTDNRHGHTRAPAEFTRKKKVGCIKERSRGGWRRKRGVKEKGRTAAQRHGAHCGATSAALRSPCTPVRWRSAVMWCRHRE